MRLVGVSHRDILIAKANYAAMNVGVISPPINGSNSTLPTRSTGRDDECVIASSTEGNTDESRTVLAIRIMGTVKMRQSADPHLNLFYSYNRDNDLIENNLTRAFIVTLGLLQPAMRSLVITRILSTAHIVDHVKLPDLNIDCTGMVFALQNHIDRDLAIAARRKFILTLSESSLMVAPNPDRQEAASVPDGWLYSSDGDYCVLIEAKVGRNPLDRNQVVSHAAEWFGLRSEEEVRSAILMSSWELVCEALVEGIENTGSIGATTIEIDLLSELLGYLRLFGYRSFRGFRLSSINEPSTMSLRTRVSKLSIDGLLPPPEFSLARFKE